MTIPLMNPAALPTWQQRWALRALHAFGWHLRIASLPGPRGVMIIYPHTSNWDFPVGVFARWAIGVNFRWLGKPALFNRFTTPLLHAWGGEAIERGVASGSIERLAQRIQAADQYWLALTPEGTRGHRDHWRSGFYHIALAAKVPLAIAYFDYAQKEVGMVDYIDLSGDVDADLARIRAAYEGRRGLKHEQAAPIRFRPDDKK
jgi:1-acyl-sn-glycerol-3-phosphate acyltransferase